MIATIEDRFASSASEDREMHVGAVEIITSVERRRRWSVAEKEQLVAATLEPWAASALARVAGIHANPCGWRRELCARPNGTPTFAAARVAEEPHVQRAALAQNSARLCQRRTLHCKLITALLPWIPESNKRVMRIRLE
jgi:transposase-like protein